MLDTNQYWVEIKVRDLLFVFAPPVPEEFVVQDLPRDKAPAVIKLESLKLADKLKEEGRQWLSEGGEGNVPIGLEAWSESWKARLEWQRSYSIRNKLHREKMWRELYSQEMSK
jgi:hypothetical protein